MVDKQLAPRQLTEKEIATKRLLDKLKVNTANYSNLSFTPEEVHKLTLYMSHLSTGSAAAIPLLCVGPSCPFAATCMFQQIGKAPIGQACVVETNLMQMWREAYILEYDIDPESMTELTFVSELAEIELMLYRLNCNLSKPEFAELVQEETVAVDREGNVLTKRVLSAFMEAKERLLARKQRVVKLMVGDRQEKYKKDAALKIRNDADPSLSSATLRRDLQALIAAAAEASKSLPPASSVGATPVASQQTEFSLSSGQEEKTSNLKPILPEDLISAMLNPEGNKQ